MSNSITSTSITSSPEMDRRVFLRLRELFQKHYNAPFFPDEDTEDPSIALLLQIALWVQSGLCTYRVLKLSEEKREMIVDSFFKMLHREEPERPGYWKSLEVADRRILYRTSINRRRLKTLLMRYCERHTPEM